MKIAIIADIHSNNEAFQAVLDSIESRGCDRIICLGDLVGYGPHPNEVIAKIIELKIPTLMGNYDEAVGFYLPHCGCHIDSNQKLLQSKNSLTWTAENTSEENKSWLRELPERLCCQYGGKVITAYHGSPCSINEYIYHDDHDRLNEIMEELNTDILLLGHTHIPFIRWVGNKLVINPGSVGKPKDGDNRASYVILELNENLNVEILRINYDIDKVVKAIRKTTLLEEFGLMLLSGKKL